MWTTRCSNDNESYRNPFVEELMSNNDEIENIDMDLLDTMDLLSKGFEEYSQMDCSELDNQFTDLDNLIGNEDLGPLVLQDVMLSASVNETDTSPFSPSTSSQQISVKESSKNKKSRNLKCKNSSLPVTVDVPLNNSTVTLSNPPATIENCMITDFAYDSNTEVNTAFLLPVTQNLMLNVSAVPTIITNDGNTAYINQHRNRILLPKPDTTSNCSVVDAKNNPAPQLQPKKKCSTNPQKTPKKNSTRKEKNKKFVCKICRKNFTTRFNLNYHGYCHRKDHIYKCVEKNCTYQTTNEAYYNRHITNHNDKVQCEVCGTMLSSLYTLARHRARNVCLKQQERIRYQKKQKLI